MARIVIQLDDDGGAPTITADEDLDIVILRQGRDLEDYDDEDIFQVPRRDIVGRMEDTVGSQDSPAIDPDWVTSVFSVVGKREISATA